MRKIFFMFLFFPLLVMALESNTTENNQSLESNSSIKSDKNESKSELNLTKEELIQKALEEQIEREKKYQREQKFYMGKDYNLDEKKVDKKILQHIEPIEPEYDFNMDDVYD